MTNDEFSTSLPVGRLFSDFEARVICDAAAGRTPCTPPAQTPEPVRVPPADSALGECIHEPLFVVYYADSTAEGGFLSHSEKLIRPLAMALSRKYLAVGKYVLVEMVD